MLATIDDEGNLHLTPETPLQTYALPKWMEDFAMGNVAVELDLHGTVRAQLQDVVGKMYAAGDIGITLGGDSCLAQRCIIIQMDSEEDVREAMKLGRLSWNSEAGA